MNFMEMLMADPSFANKMGALFQGDQTGWLPQALAKTAGPAPGGGGDQSSFLRALMQQMQPQNAAAPNATAAPAPAFNPVTAPQPAGQLAGIEGSNAPFIAPPPVGGLTHNVYNPYQGDISQYGLLGGNAPAEHNFFNRVASKNPVNVFTEPGAPAAPLPGANDEDRDWLDSGDDE